MSQEIPEFVRADVIQFIENPTKYYLKFSKSVRQDIKMKSFDTLYSRLKYFNDLCGEDKFKEIATIKIEEFVNRGMVDKMLWEIFENLKSQPISPSVTNAMMAEIQTLWNLFEDSTIAAKRQICYFLPFLVKDIIGNEKYEQRLRIEAAKLINNLLQQASVDLLDLPRKLKCQKPFCYNVGTLITNAADFELQAQLLELVFRLVTDKSERTEWASRWFESEDLQNIFLSIEDQSFEPGCRKFLNKINEDQKGVFSIPCQMMLFGSEKIPLAKYADTGYHWLDFNFGSKTLKFFFEEKEDTPSQNEDDDVWWRTVVIAHDNVVDCSLSEQQDSVLLKITLKEDVTNLVPSWPSDDVHVVQIIFGSDCDVNKLREVLESFSWIRPDFCSPPRASVAVFSVHLADRQQGEMQLVETMDSPTPEEMIEEDGIRDEDLVNDSDITATLDGKDMEESEELLPSPDKAQEQPKIIKITSAESQDRVEETEDCEVHPKASQAIKADHDSPEEDDNADPMSKMSTNIKAAEKTHSKQNQPAPDEVDKVGKNSPVSQDKDLIKAKNVTENEHDEEKIKNQKQMQRAHDKSEATSIPPETKSRASDESDTDTESGASRRSSKRIPRGKARTKRNKSPLPVEIMKSDRRKSSSSSVKSSTDSENERKSPERKKQKSYPSAFNVAKRMDAKKNNMLSSSSQEMKKKVFGPRGSTLGKKVSLHIMEPARRADHFKRMKSEKMPTSKKRNSRNKDTRTEESAGEQSEHTTEEDEVEKDVIQDSMPLDDSPEPVPSRRRSEVPKDSLTKVSDRRLVQSESVKRTSHRIQFVNDSDIPTRLGTILRKGSQKHRDSLLDESTRWGSGSSSTSSTSDTDWPGPDVEPGPKLKHSLVLCKSVRESRPSTRKPASQRGRKKRASISPNLSAISEEKSPSDIPQVQKGRKELSDEFENEETRQDTHQAQDKPAKSSDNRAKKRGGQIDGLGDMEKEQDESGNTSEDTVVYETTSSRQTRSTAKASEESRPSRRKKEENKKAIPTNKENQNKTDFEQEFDFDLPDLTIEAAEGSLARSEKGERKSADLPKRSASSKDKKARDKSAADKKGMPLAKDDVGSEEDDGVYTQDYTRTESRHKRKDRSHGRTGDRESRSEEDNDDELYRENRNAKKKPKYHDNVKPKESRNKKEYSEQRRQPMVSSQFSEDVDDEDSDFPKERKSPKQRKTYAKKLKPIYTSTPREEDNWISDKETDNKNRATDVPRLGWQLPSKKNPAKLPAQKTSNSVTKSDAEEFHSGYENDDRDAPEYDQGYTESYHRKETRNTRSRAPTSTRQQSEKQSKVLGKPRERVVEVEEDEDEVIKLRRFCQDITAVKSSTPASENPRKRRDEEIDDDMPAKKCKDSEVQGTSDGQMSDNSGKTPSKHGENVENSADHSVPRSRTTTNERHGARHGSTSKYKTPNTNPSRLDDSGLGQSIGTGSRRRTSVTHSKGSTTPKGRRKGELLITTSNSKTPITPRTSAIMRRIDEEEDFAHTKKPRQVFIDWTSSGPSRTVSTLYQDPYSPETKNDDHQDREQNRAPERLKGKREHNPNIKPRQLFAQIGNAREDSPEEGLHEDRSSSSEDMEDISNILSGLGENLSERLRRKRQNLQRFCKRTTDVTIETMNRHFEQNLSIRDEMIDSFNDKFLEEIKTLKDEMDKAKKTEEQILGKVEEDIKQLKTRRILQENKIKGLRNMCVEFQSEMIKGDVSQPDNQGTFQDEIRQELARVQEHFLLEAQRQDRENLRRSLTSVLDATMM